MGVHLNEHKKSVKEVGSIGHLIIAFGALERHVMLP